MPRQITVRGVPPELARRLAEMGRARGASLNAIVLHILKQAAGVDERRHRLARYATWNREDLREFDSALAAQRVVDEQAWK